MGVDVEASLQRADRLNATMLRTGGVGSDQG